MWPWAVLYSTHTNLQSKYVASPVRGRIGKAALRALDSPKNNRHLMSGRAQANSSIQLEFRVAMPVEILFIAICVMNQLSLLSTKQKPSTASAGWPLCWAPCLLVAIASVCSVTWRIFCNWIGLAPLPIDLKSCVCHQSHRYIFTFVLTIGLTSPRTDQQRLGSAISSRFCPSGWLLLCKKKIKQK